ncbi:MAG: Sec-independent protein translocase protein TatB [Burkholderiales bacterium]|jgi:sec-independent protein translocase protein TatB
MFNFGISELMIIAVVGLIVIGPERLPRVARTLGHLIGRMQRYVSDIKADINREVELDELRQLQSTMKDAAEEIEKSVSKQVNYVEDEVKQAEAETRKNLEDAVKPAEAETRKNLEDAVKPATGINLMESVDSPEKADKQADEGSQENGDGEAAAPEMPETARAEPNPDSTKSGSGDKQT